MKQIVRSLPCVLTPKELDAAGESLAKKLGEKDSILARRKAIGEQLWGKKKVVEAEIARLVDKRPMRPDELQGSLSYEDVVGTPLKQKKGRKGKTSNPNDQR